MKTRVQELIEVGNRLYSDRSGLESIWQDIALNFYPERADFTTQRSMGTEFAAHLITGVPALARRDMANTLSAMLRPRGQPWFHGVTNDERINKDPMAKKWLEWATEIQRKFFYERQAQFNRATKEGDNDFVTFGQTVIEMRERAARDGLLFLCHHLRDVAWLENAELEIEQVHRKGLMRPNSILQTWARKGDGKLGVHHKVQEAAEKEPAKKFNTRHIVLPRDQYDLKDGAADRKRPGGRLPFVSIHIDVDNEQIMEECGCHEIQYVIPRWQTVSGSQYAHSPATVIALSDARMLQQINLTLLEAGQKAVDPPLIAMSEMIQGGVNSGAGMITWVDADYDERLGEVLRPLQLDKSGLTWGDALQERIEGHIKEAFYLNQLSMPDTTGEMTAYEVQKRFEEYMRRALPLFEPMESEYNGALCDLGFTMLLRNGAFGNPRDMPPILRGQEVKFSFASPLQQAQNRANSQAFMESANLLKIASEIDPSVRHILDVQTATRDALEGAQAPATWFNSAEQVIALQQSDAQAQAQQNAMTQLQQGAAVAGQVGDAVGKVRDGVQPAQPPGRQPTPQDAAQGDGQPQGNPADGSGPQIPPQLAALAQALQNKAA